MGWSNGGFILDSMANTLEKHLKKSPKQQEDILLSLVYTLEDCDADTLDECFGSSRACDRALKRAGYGVEVE